MKAQVGDAGIVKSKQQQMKLHAEWVAAVAAAPTR